jgi:hypothetical protein
VRCTQAHVNRLAVQHVSKHPTFAALLANLKSKPKAVAVAPRLL